MKFHVIDHPPKSAQEKALLVLHVTEGDTKLPSMASWIDKETGGELKAEIKRKKFKGTVGSSILVPTKYGPSLLVGIGKRPVTLDTIRKGAATAVQEARAHHYGVVVTPVTGGKRLSAEAVAQAVTEGALLGDYRFHKYKQNSKRSEIDFYFTQGGKLNAAAKRGVTKGEATATAQNVARDLSNEPASHLTPKQFAAEAKQIAATHGLGYTVLGPTELKKEGLGAILAVSKGSDEPPQLIKLTYKPKGAKKHVVLIGKSVTYDSGGLNLKPAKGGLLEEMKLDMSAGAAVLAAMSALKALGIKNQVTAYLPATENLISGSAYKPGDVIHTYNGKTIEVGNTDAEGRLTLADTLAYAVKQDKPDVIIDLATLTATDVSLGPAYAAVFANRPELETALRAAGEETGEKLWPLPMPEEYNDMTKSAVADYSNIVQGRAYTLAGAMLLKNFVGETPWAHIDIGGPSLTDKDSGYNKKGGSGWSTRLLLEYLQHA